MCYLWSKISLWSSEKNEIILILISFNVIFRILKNQYLIPGPDICNHLSHASMV